MLWSFACIFSFFVLSSLSAHAQINAAYVGGWEKSTVTRRAEERFKTIAPRFREAIRRLPPDTMKEPGYLIEDNGSVIEVHPFEFYLRHLDDTTLPAAVTLEAVFQGQIRGFLFFSKILIDNEKRRPGSLRSTRPTPLVFATDNRTLTIGDPGMTFAQEPLKKIESHKVKQQIQKNRLVVDILRAGRIHVTKQLARGAFHFFKAEVNGVTITKLEDVVKTVEPLRILPPFSRFQVSGDFNESFRATHEGKQLTGTAAVHNSLVEDSAMLRISQMNIAHSVRRFIGQRRIAEEDLIARNAELIFSIEARDDQILLTTVREAEDEVSGVKIKIYYKL